MAAPEVQRAVADGGDPPRIVAPGVGVPPAPPAARAPVPPWKMWMCPGPPAPLVYSLAETPMRRNRHSIESAPPVDTAIFGKSPSVAFRGSRRLGSGLSWHGLTSMAYWRRHLPIWTTRGTAVPSGAFWRTNRPSASVSEPATTPPV